MTERVALYLQDSHDLRDGLEYAKYAEEKGFEAVWQAESRLVRDAIVPDRGGHLRHGARVIQGCQRPAQQILFVVRLRLAVVVHCSNQAQNIVAAQRVTLHC